MALRLARRRLNTFGNIAATPEGFQKGSKQRRFPPGSCNEGAVEKRTLAVRKRCSVGPVDETARGKQHGVARRRIPFACRRGAGINVGVALGEDAELQG